MSSQDKELNKEPTKEKEADKPSRIEEALEAQVEKRKSLEKQRQEERAKQDELIDEKYRFKNEKECRVAYQDVIAGFTFHEKESVYIKHFADEDVAYLDSSYLKAQKNAEEKGLLKEEDKLKLLKDNDHWSDEDELAYQQTLSALTQLIEQKSKLIFKTQVSQITEIIHKYQVEHKKSLQDRSELVGITSENYVNKTISEVYIYRSLYQDEDLKNPLFSEDEFAELDEEEVSEWSVKYNESLSKFNEKNFKRIGIQWFFMNSFNCCDENPFVFFGKPVTELTLYQIALFSKGKYYKFITGEKGTPPSDMNFADGSIDMEKYVKWYDQKYHEILRGREKQIRESKRGGQRSTRPSRKRG